MIMVCKFCLQDIMPSDKIVGAGGIYHKSCIEKLANSTQCPFCDAPRDAHHGWPVLIPNVLCPSRDGRGWPIECGTGKTKRILIAVCVGMLVAWLACAMWRVLR